MNEYFYVYGSILNFRTITNICFLLDFDDIHSIQYLTPNKKNLRKIFYIFDRFTPEIL